MLALFFFLSCHFLLKVQEIQFRHLLIEGERNTSTSPNWCRVFYGIKYSLQHGCQLKTLAWIISFTVTINSCQLVIGSFSEATNYCLEAINKTQAKKE